MRNEYTYRYIRPIITLIRQYGANPVTYHRIYRDTQGDIVLATAVYWKLLSTRAFEHSSLGSWERFKALSTDLSQRNCQYILHSQVIYESRNDCTSWLALQVLPKRSPTHVWLAQAAGINFGPGTLFYGLGPWGLLACTLSVRSSMEQ